MNINGHIVAEKFEETDEFSEEEFIRRVKVRRSIEKCR